MHSPKDGPQGPAAYPSLKGRSVIVTGGGQGIGRCMALALAERGACVVATAARGTDSLIETAAMAKDLAGTVVTLQADIRSPEDCARTVDTALSEFGTLHALVNNAARGIAYVRAPADGAALPFWEIDGARWAETMTTNVIGTFQMSAAAGPHMISQGFGRIVNVSTSDRSMIREHNSPYGPSKAALEAMSVAWSKEAADHGVTVNVLLPGGATQTRMITGVTKREPLPPSVMNPAILWLCADQSNGHTGGRYIASVWDSAADPTAAADGARQPSHEMPVIM
ncbi:MAG: NAD(P)-dependent dehydrogenase (short-subunit alcohol dehydrogenase family) [Paracoccaceae bacterium]|jgi:NAD(P)-dependent dehydrogenase (short-subunit alcohol dehydrogenase family)